MSNSILIFSEREQLAYEILSRVRRIAEKRTLISICSSEEEASGLFTYGADLVLVERNPEFKKLYVDIYLQLLHKVVNEYSPSVIIFGATKFGNELAARLAQRLNAGCATDCLDLELDPVVKISRLYYSGKFIAEQEFRTTAIITMEQRRLDIIKDESRKGEIIYMQTELKEQKVRVINSRQKEKSNLQIESAETIVAVGRGLKSKEDLAMIQEFANTIEGMVAGSRPITEDLHWLPSDVQIGLSGKKVKPKLYIACGISGQIQHIVGMRDSKIVVAINTDEQAPIMQEADYCIVYDLYRFIPAFNKTLKDLLHR